MMAIIRAAVWGAAAFFLTVVHPVSWRTGLLITVVASVFGAFNGGRGQ
jgi:hypothetical protein